MKKPIDIEKLVQWAVRDELPKGRAVSDDIGSIVIRRAARNPFGISIDRPPREIDAFGFVPGTPHDDALAVSDAITALATDARFDDIAEVLALFGDLAAIAHDAASSIRAASFDCRALVICKAAQSIRPQWEFPQPTPRQMFVEFRNTLGALRSRPLVNGIDADGDTVSLESNRGRAVARDGLYDYAYQPRSPLEWGSLAKIGRARDWCSLVAIGHARAEYVAWFDALASLACALDGKLQTFAPLPPSLNRAPWISGQVPASRVLDDGMPPGLLTVKLALAPKRHAGGKPIESKIEATSRQYRAQAAADRRRLKAADSSVFPAAPQSGLGR